MICGYHKTMHSAEGRKQFSWSTNTRAPPQGSAPQSCSHPAQGLTLRMSSRKAFLSPLNWVTLGPASSLLACTLSSLREDRHRANTASPWGMAVKRRSLESWASLLLSEVLKHQCHWVMSHVQWNNGAQMNYSNSIPEGQYCHSVQALGKYWLIKKKATSHPHENLYPQEHWPPFSFENLL